MSKGRRLKRVEESLFGGNGKNREDMVVGQFISNARGFGFVAVEGMDEDIFIPEDYVHGAFHNDTVEVEILPVQSGKRKEGRKRYFRDSRNLPGREELWLCDSRQR